MRYESRVLPVLETPGLGTPFRVDSMRELVLQVTGTFTATLNVMGQLVEGGPWLQIGSDISAAGWVVLPVHPLFAIRLDTEAWTSEADLAVVLAGWNHRGE